MRFFWLIFILENTKLFSFSKTNCKENHSRMDGRWWYFTKYILSPIKCYFLAASPLVWGDFCGSERVWVIVLCSLKHVLVLQNLLHQKLGGGVDVGVQPSGGVKPATEVVFLAVSVQHLVVNVSSFYITLSKKKEKKKLKRINQQPFMSPPYCPITPLV